MTQTLDVTEYNKILTVSFASCVGWFIRFITRRECSDNVSSTILCFSQNPHQEIKPELMS